MARQTFVVRNEALATATWVLSSMRAADHVKASSVEGCVLVVALLTA